MMTGLGRPSEHNLWASYNTDVWNKKKLLDKGQRFKQEATTTETDTIFQNKNKKSRQKQRAAIRLWWSWQYLHAASAPK